MKKTVLTCVLGAAASLSLGGMASAGPEEPQDKPSCRAVVSPGNLDTNIDKIEIAALLSTAIGDVKSASAQVNSGLAVADVKSTDETSVTIAMSTKAARPGTWTVTFAGEHGTCTGQVAVTKAKRK